MKKLIVKTAVITTVAMAVAMLLFFIVFQAFMPKTLADFYIEAGRTDRALVYLERVYDKEPSTDNLKEVLQCAIAAKDAKKTVSYAQTLIDCDDFINEDAGYRIYIQGEYAVALYRRGQVKRAVDSAFDFGGDYVSLNPVERLLLEIIEQADNQNTSAIQQTLLDIQARMSILKTEKTDEFSDDGISRLDDDIDNLSVYLSR